MPRRLEDVLAAGPRSTVWRARRHRPGERPVAVKRVRALDPGAAALAAGRLRALAAIEHPHLLRVFEVTGDDDGTTIVMQLADGGSLADLVAERGALESGEVVAIAAPIAEALAAAHARGLVHGDVSASNILLAADGTPLLTDFGEPHHATEGCVAPEVARGHEASAQSDSFSVAAVCRDALTDDSQLAPVLAAALADDPDDRPTCGELAHLLRAAVPIADVRLPGAATATATVERRTRRFGPRPPLPRAPSPKRAKPLLLLLALPLVLGVWWASHPSGASAASPCEAPPDVLPAGAQLVEGDTSGRGCLSVGVYADQVLTIRLDPSDPAPRRFALGRPGDRIRLGDWNCDGRSSPSVERPSTGEAFFYDSWATDAVPSRQPVCAQSVR